MTAFDPLRPFGPAANWAAMLPVCGEDWHQICELARLLTGYARPCRIRLAETALYDNPLLKQRLTKDFDALFITDKPIIFAFHGCPWLIHHLTYRRNGHHNIHVRGYMEEGTTSTPFDMCVMNDLDRFHLVGDLVDRVTSLGARAAYAKQAIRDKLIEHKKYIARYGDDVPEIKDRTWGQTTTAAARRLDGGR